MQSVTYVTQVNIRYKSIAPSFRYLNRISSMHDIICADCLLRLHLTLSLYRFKTTNIKKKHRNAFSRTQKSLQILQTTMPTKHPLPKSHGDAKSVSLDAKCAANGPAKEAKWLGSQVYKSEMHVIC